MTEKTYTGVDGKRYPAELERTEQGLQIMLAGVRPVSMKEKLAFLIEQSMSPRKKQKACDIGLFDFESRNQLELF